MLPLHFSASLLNPGLHRNQRWWKPMEYEPVAKCLYREIKEQGSRFYVGEQYVTWHWNDILPTWADEDGVSGNFLTDRGHFELALGSCAFQVPGCLAGYSWADLFRNVDGFLASMVLSRWRPSPPSFHFAATSKLTSAHTSEELWQASWRFWSLFGGFTSWYACSLVPINWRIVMIWGMSWQGVEYR